MFCVSSGTRVEPGKHNKPVLGATVPTDSQLCYADYVLRSSAGQDILLRELPHPLTYDTLELYKRSEPGKALA